MNKSTLTLKPHPNPFGTPEPPLKLAFALFIHTGRLRLAIQRAQERPDTPAPSPAPNSSDWLEHIPPKLTNAMVDDLVQKFKTNYPAETLNSHTMPSLRLLSMVHDGLKTRLKWIPWQYRLSQKQYQEQIEAKNTKALRSELQLLHFALRDDQPELNIDNRPLSAGWLHKIQCVFRNALALCQAARLVNLKNYDEKIADLCLTQPDRNSGLRTVTTGRAAPSRQETMAGHHGDVVSRLDP